MCHGVRFTSSVDEVASFHEATIGPLPDMLGLSGWLYYPQLKRGSWASDCADWQGIRRRPLEVLFDR